MPRRRAGAVECCASLSPARGGRAPGRRLRSSDRPPRVERAILLRRARCRNAESGAPPARSAVARLDHAGDSLPDAVSARAGARPVRRPARGAACAASEVPSSTGGGGWERVPSRSAHRARRGDAASALVEDSAADSERVSAPVPGGWTGRCANCGPPSSGDVSSPPSPAVQRRPSRPRPSATTQERSRSPGEAAVLGAEDWARAQARRTVLASVEEHPRPAPVAAERRPAAWGRRRQARRADRCSRPRGAAVARSVRRPHSGRQQRDHDAHRNPCGSDEDALDRPILLLDRNVRPTGAFAW